MSRDQRSLLVEQVVSAWRPPDPRGGVRSHPAWHDLDAEGREAAYRATVVQRRLEASLDPEGLSATARAVLSRVR